MKAKRLSIFFIIALTILITGCKGTLFVKPGESSPINYQKSPLATPTIPKAVIMGETSIVMPNPNPSAQNGKTSVKQRLPNPTATHTPSPTITPTATPSPSATATIESTATRTVAPTIPPTPSPASTKVFTDKEAGYSFSYNPHEARLKIDSKANRTYKTVTITFINQSEVSEFQTMQIFVMDNDKGLSGNELLTQIYQETRQENPPENLSTVSEAFTFGEYPALKTTLLAPNGDTYAFHTLILTEDRAYLVGLPYATMNGTQVYPQSIEWFYKILETFTIHNPWQIYTDEEAGYSFSYKPNKTQLTADTRPIRPYSPVTLTFINQPEISEQQAIQVFVIDNLEGLSSDELLTQIYQETRQENPPENLLTVSEAFTFGEYPALKTTLLAPNGDIYAFHILILTEDRAYLVGLTYAVMNGNQVNSQSIEHLYEIIETFTIHDPWQVYTDEEAGYSFSYKPNEGRLSVSKKDEHGYKRVSIVFINQSKVRQYQAMYIFVWPNPNYLSGDELLAYIYQELREKTPSENLSSLSENIIIGGQPAIKTTMLSGGTYPFYILIPNKDKVYLAGPSYGAIGGTHVFPESIERFYKILETFTLLPNS